MSTIDTISKIPPADIAMDFARLREEGLKYIEQLGSDFWTDYNTHDPGITLLELLCYAITDLAYRTNMPVEDLLSSPGDNNQNFKKQFFSAKEILPTKPVCELDLRKLLIDIDGIKNVWIFKSKQSLFFDKKESRVVGGKPPHNHASLTFSLNGLYHFKIELDEEPIAKDCNKATNPTPQEIEAAEQRKKIAIEKVKKRFHLHRGLCEDLVDVSVVEEQKIRFCMDIDVAAQVDANDVYPKVLYLIDRYLSPSIRQYSLKEMVTAQKANGDQYTMDEIFSGPALDHGFFKDDELINASLRKSIYASDIINLIMDIPGVKAVRNFLMNYSEEDANVRHEWCLPVSEGKKPVLNYCKSAINFYKDVIPVKAPRQQAVNKWFQILIEERNAALSLSYDDYAYAGGAWRHTDAYTSITNNLPLCYGVGEAGLSPSVPFDRTIKAVQLKAYLLFYDQLLANYIAQLNGLKKLFQLKDSAITNPGTGTYFFQKISDISEAKYLIDNYDSIGNAGNVLDTITKAHDNAVDRKNRLLDHLLSRFAEDFTEYVLQMYTLQGQQSAEKLVISKNSLLKEYPHISAARSLGYDYYNSTNEKGEVLAVWDTENVSGMEHRLSRLLGIKDYKRRNLSAPVTDGSDEGMYVVEHILLRPGLDYLKEKNGLLDAANFIPVCKGDDCDDCGVDPYSFRVTVILPAESQRFKDFDFRNYIEKTIRLETPAHIYPRVCWWSRADITAFEPVYKKWLEVKQSHTENTDEGLQVLQELIKILNNRKSVYPPGVLSDCDNPVDNPVILGKSNLGNLKT